MKGFCAGCKQTRVDIIVNESSGVPFCASCIVSTPVPSTVRALEFLAVTVPFEVGDEVEAKTAGVLRDGIGHVKKVSFDLQCGGTPVFPTFLVEFDQKDNDSVPDEAWYTEVCLTKVGASK